MKKKNIRQWILLICGIALAGLVSSKYFFRIDLTSEKRYTLSSETKLLLRRLDAPLYVDIFLDGNLPVQFRKFRNSVREMLDDFKAYSGSRIVYRFIDPNENADRQEREKRYESLENAGIRSVPFLKENKDGSQSQQIIFPGAMLSYKNRQSAANLLNNNIPSIDVALNVSLEALEYELIKIINLLSADSIGRVAYTTGHGELSRAEIYDFCDEFVNSNPFNIDPIAINGQLNVLDTFKAVIIARPREAFDEKDKFVIDRYIMRGGKVLWLINGADVNTDSLFARNMTFALPLQLNLEDQLFIYGVRINQTVVQDIRSNEIPVILGEGASRSTSTAPWLYYPVIIPSYNHVITRNLSPVWLRYASDIDTVGRDNNIRKTVLLQTSEWTRTRGLPLMIRLSDIERMPEQEQFNKPHRITALLLEGQFPSAFRNRNTRNLFSDLQEKLMEKSVDTKMIVVSDGDIARNDITSSARGFAPSNPLGYDRYTRMTFANKDFLINALNYLTDDDGLMNLRNRELKMRLLNKQKMMDEQLKWQMINLVLPMLLLLIGGLVYNRWRIWRYGR